MILLLWLKPSVSAAPATGTVAAKLAPVATFAPAATVRTFNA